MTFKVSISAVDGTVSKAECGNQSQYLINILFKQKVNTLISSQICFYWFFSFLNLCPFYFTTTTLGHLFERLFSFSYHFKIVLWNYHLYSCKYNAIIKQFKLVFNLKQFLLCFPDDCTGGSDQDRSPKKEMQKGKMAVWGGLTNSWEKKRG